MLIVLAFILFMSGCTLRYGDGLLVAPRLPEEYNLLQTKLDEITAGERAFQISADSGTDRQSVQLKDLDGDGEDEAVAFFRTNDGVVQVYVFYLTEEGYTQVGLAEGPGYLRWVRYPVLDKEGTLGLAVAWGQEGALTGVSIFRLRDGALELLLDTNYAYMTFDDYDGNGTDEPVLVRQVNALGGEERYTLSFYTLRDGAYKEVSTVDLCKDVRSVSSFSVSREPGQVTLYVDSQSTTGNYVTDIIRYDGVQAVNLTIDPASGEGSLSRSMSVLSRDIDGDGVIDVPVTDRVDRPGESAAAIETRSSRLIWKKLLPDGSFKDMAKTYHNVADKWYLAWPEAWGDEVYAERASSLYQKLTKFYIMAPDIVDSENGTNIAQQPVLFIHVFSGDDRDQHSKMYSSVEILKRTATDIYGYSIPDGVPTTYALSPEQVRSLFSTIDTNYWRNEVY